ncbi:hypothetical protein M153_2030005853 [Pseudoloma neurophilia]|uniref:Uncharacterized protein n=1 Tax=Pseudoloma neurophilia TaxID=146866 RepID=A0A0R0LZ89_9MICR|nr:hypothetical protein M153_2030005853 [Pseudoloma neurophilia]
MNIYKDIRNQSDNQVKKVDNDQSYIVKFDKRSERKAVGNVNYN